MPIQLRYLNDYKLVFAPKHSSSMSSDNWKGWIYEHILIAESLVGRPLLENEVVHHLDCDPTNNDCDNLLVIDRGQHRKIHTWIDNGALVCESYKRNGVNSGKPKGESSVTKECRSCGIVFFNRNKLIEHCSTDCAHKSARRVERPTKAELEKLVWEVPTSILAKRYGVSDVAISKWCKTLGITKPSRGYWTKSKAILSETSDAN